MKKVFLLSLGILALGVLFVRYTLLTNAVTFVGTDPGNDSRCLQIKVKFNADASWKENSTQRYIYAGCDGQGTITNPKNGPPGCTGGLVKLKPGEEATLGRCSCFNIRGVTNQEGCLKIGKEAHIEPRIDGAANRRNVIIDQELEGSNKCKVTYTDRAKNKKVSDIKYFCGTNEQKFSAGVNINCEVPPTPTPTPTGTPTPSPSGSPTPSPSSCPTPAPVTNVKITCPNCNKQGPTPAPTPLTSASCGNSTNPIAEVIGPSDQSADAGSDAHYSLKITSCSASKKQYFVFSQSGGTYDNNLPSDMVEGLGTSAFSLSPGESFTDTITIGSYKTRASGPYSDQFFAVTSSEDGLGDEVSSNKVTLKYTVK